MDALVEGLMEELNCETVFTIPLFGGIRCCYMDYHGCCVSVVYSAKPKSKCGKPQSQTGSCRNSSKGAQ